MLLLQGKPGNVVPLRVYKENDGFWCRQGWRHFWSACKKARSSSASWSLSRIRQSSEKRASFSLSPCWMSLCTFVMAVTARDLFLALGTLMQFLWLVKTLIQMKPGETMLWAIRTITLSSVPTLWCKNVLLVLSRPLLQCSLHSCQLQASSWLCVSDIT